MHMIDIIGMKFNRWLVLSRAANDPVGKAMFLCRCDCGSEKVIQGILLRRGVSKSCGCMKLEMLSKRQKTHGHTTNKTMSPTYHSWVGMMARCSNPNHRAYKNYGALGITICDRWHTFSNFLEDMGEKPPRMSIDRIDCKGNYEPGNCRWATSQEQARNKSNNAMLTANGKTMCVAEWAEELKINPASLSHRINAGWSHHDAINKPISANAKDAARNHKNSKLVTFNGQTKCLAEWSELTGIKYTTLSERLRAGWPVEKALTLR